MNSELFDKKQARKSFMIIGFALSAFLVIGYGLILLLQNIFDRYFIFHGAYMDIVLFVLEYLCLYGIGFLIYMLIVRIAPKDDTAKVKFSFGRLFSIFVIIYPLMIGGNIIGTIIESIVNPNNTTAEKLMDFASGSNIFVPVVMIIAAPIVEELIFRKFMIDRTKKYGEKTAIVFSAFCFGMYHMNITQFLYAVAIGCVFGYVYSRSGKIHYTMIMHAIINGTTYILSTCMGHLSTKMGNIGTDLVNPNTLAIDTAKIQEFISSITAVDVIAFVVLILIIIMQYVFAIIGFVFIFTRARKVRFVKEGPYIIPKGQGFKTICLNAGVILFFVITLAMIVFQLVVRL